MPSSEELEELYKIIKSSTITNHEYNRCMNQLALLKREEYGLGNSPLSLKIIRSIYSREKIRIDKARKKLKKLRAAYFCQDGDFSVLLCPGLPDEPKLFSLVHELKHHYVDQDRLTIACYDVTDKSDRIEIGAEVFAAEFILPTADFVRLVESNGIRSGSCSPEEIVRLKVENKLPLSYQAICKRIYYLSIMPKGYFDKVQFTKVRDRIYGIPFYRRNLNRKRT